MENIDLKQLRISRSEFHAFTNCVRQAIDAEAGQITISEEIMDRLEEHCFQGVKPELIRILRYYSS